MKLQVWDLSTRLFHWLLALTVGFLVFSGETGNLFDWHKTAGIIVVALLVYRVIWGLFGSTTARFSDFIYSPSKIIGYAKNMFSRRAEPHAGHNPVGGLMVVVMLGLLLFQGVTGLFASDDFLVEGPLFSLVDEDTAFWLTDLHHSSAEFLMPIIVLHIVAILFYRLYKKHDLVKPMITGNAEFSEAPSKSVTMKPAMIGLAVLVVVCLVVYFGLEWFGG